MSEILAEDSGLETSMPSIVPLLLKATFESNSGFRIDLASAVSLHYTNHLKYK